MSNILITGGTGFIGQALTELLQQANHSISTLSRQPKGANQFSWQPDEGSMDVNALENQDIVIHLAGESLFTKRWSAKRKNYLKHNRQSACKTLIHHINEAANPPRTLIVASAIGFYGDTAEKVVDEHSPKGDNFPAEICQLIETEAGELDQNKTKLVIARLGVVIDKSGGAVKQLLPPFKSFLGGPIGNGQQWMSWISLKDCIAGFQYFIDHQDCQGCYNLTSPNPVSNQQFSSVLAQTLHRPCWLPLPAFAVRLLFGEMGESLLLANANVLPTKLTHEGFEFAYPSIDQALSATLS